MYTNELMLMISKFLYDEYNAAEFSFDFPARLSEVYDEFVVENENLCDLLEDEMPEICSWFDPHSTGCEGTTNEQEFKQKVLAVYSRALPLVVFGSKKVS